MKSHIFPHMLLSDLRVWLSKVQTSLRFSLRFMKQVKRVHKHLNRDNNVRHQMWSEAFKWAHLTYRDLSLISTVTSLSLSPEWIHDDQSDQIKEDKQMRSAGTHAGRFSACSAKQHANQGYQWVQLCVCVSVSLCVSVSVCVCFAGVLLPGFSCFSIWSLLPGASHV